jgi:putative membrane protein
MAEVAVSELATEKGDDVAVRSYAARMIEDHAPANERLAAAAAEHGIDLPTEPAPDQRAMMAELEALSGLQFDIAFMAGQVVEHQKTVQLLEWEINSGQDIHLGSFAKESLPTVLAHLQTAKDLLVTLRVMAASRP